MFDYWIKIGKGEAFLTREMGVYRFMNDLIRTCVECVIVVMSLTVPFYHTHLCKAKDVIVRKNETVMLKAFAILIVIISHFFRYIDCNKTIKIIQSFGFLGASLFCLLSSYGCTKSYIQKGVTRNSLIRKFVRIYFPFVIINILTVFLELNVWGGFLNIINYTIGLKLIDNVLWYVPFIIVCDILIWLIYKIVKSFLARQILLYLICFIYILGAQYGGVESQWYTSVLCIPLGCFLAEQELRICRWNVKWSVLFTISSWIGFIVLVGINLLFRNFEFIKNWTTTLASLFFGLGFMIPLSKLEVHSIPIVKSIGISSYWIYLIHMKIIRASFLNKEKPMFLLFLVQIIFFSITFSIIKNFINSRIKNNLNRKTHKKRI